VRSCVDDNTDDHKNETADMQRQDGEASAAGQWQLEHSVEDEFIGCDQLLGHAGDGQSLSVTDDVYSCYDDEMSYINYQHHHHRHHHAPAQSAVVDTAAAPTLTGVQVCGPAASFELLFLIDQLASTAYFVDDPGAFMTLMQTAAAAPPPAYIDYSSPRIVELSTDDENNNRTAPCAASTTGHTDASPRRGDQLLDKDADVTTSADATARGTVEEDSKKASSTTAEDRSENQSETTGDDRGQARRRQKRSGQQQKEKTSSHDAETHVQSSDSLRGRQHVPDGRGNVVVSSSGGQVMSKDNEPTATTNAVKTVKRFHATTAGRQQQQRHLPAADARTSTMQSKADDETTTVRLTSLLADRSAGGQRDKYKLPDLFVERKPPLVPAAGVARRPEPTSLGRGGGLRLPPVSANNSHGQRTGREAARAFPQPPQRRRSHPLAPRRPMTPANRNVLTSRAVWPSMASGRPVEDDWTRRAAVMRRRPARLPPLQQTASVATWN